MALPAIADFEGLVDGAALAGNWTQQQTSTVKSDAIGHAFVNAGITNVHVYWNADVFPDDQLSALIINTNQGSDSTGKWDATVRAAGTTAATKDFYSASTNMLSGAGNTELRECLNGTFSVLGSLAATFVGGDELECEVQGTLIRMKKNSTQVGTDVSDTTLTSGSAGFGGDGGSTGPFFDSWRGDAASIPSTPAPIRSRKLATQQRMVIP